MTSEEPRKYTLGNLKTVLVCSTITRRGRRAAHATIGLSLLDISWEEKIIETHCHRNGTRKGMWDQIRLNKKTQ